MKFSKREMHAIENLKEDLLNLNMQGTDILISFKDDIEVILNLIEKLNKENFELNREMTDFNDQWIHKDRIRKMKAEIDEEIERVENDNRLTDEGKDNFITVLLSKNNILEKILKSS